MSLNEVLELIEKNCALYFSGELDEPGFREGIHSIPVELWQEKSSALSILQKLTENESLYEVSLQERDCFFPFICKYLPQAFWDHPEYILDAASMAADFMSENLEWVDTSAFEPFFQRLPQEYWEDSTFVTNAAELVIHWSRLIDDLSCISELIPESVWKTDVDLRWVILSIYNDDDRNMSYLSLFPDKVWQSPESMCLVLSCLAAALENDRAWGTMYPNFRGSDEEYLEEFLCYVPDSFKSNPDFLIELMDVQYFSDTFSVLFNWVDPVMWENKEFVLTALENDPDSVLHIPDALAADEEIHTYVEENVDLDRIKHITPPEQLPQWIRDWRD